MEAIKKRKSLLLRRDGGVVVERRYRLENVLPEIPVKGRPRVSLLASRSDEVYATSLK